MGTPKRASGLNERIGGTIHLRRIKPHPTNNKTPGEIGAKKNTQDRSGCYTDMKKYMRFADYYGDIRISGNQVIRLSGNQGVGYQVIRLDIQQSGEREKARNHLSID